MHQDLSTCYLVRSIQSGCRPSVLLADKTYALVLGCEALDDVYGMVGRAVVTHDHFELGVRLVEHALQRLADVVGVVVVGHEDGYERLDFEWREVQGPGCWGAIR
jgi:hypothetical protein